MQNQILLLKNDVINGFSYSFSKILLDQFMKKKVNMQIFEFNPSGNLKRFSPLAKNLISYLKQQVPYTGWSEIDIMAEYADYKISTGNRESLDKMFIILLEKISKAEEETFKFLKIFESYK